MKNLLSFFFSKQKMQMAFYGVAQNLSDRTLVADVIRCYIDTNLYYTPPAIKNDE